MEVNADGAEEGLNFKHILLSWQNSEMGAVHEDEVNPHDILQSEV